MYSSVYDVLDGCTAFYALECCFFFLMNIIFSLQCQKEMHRMSSITCEDLEKNYLHFLEDNSHDVVKFTAGKQCYELNFKSMFTHYILLE